MAAFTLIELSIVLVIIGLIVGGVLVGQDLIRSAEIRSTLTQIERYNTAANTFIGKYGCLPGDCANATTFWGLSNQCSINNNPFGSNTCNGDGNGQISSAFTGSGNSIAHSETILFWQQLGLAGLIAPINGSVNAAYAPNAPTAPLQNTCISIAYGFPDDGTIAGAQFDISATSRVAGHFFRLGNPAQPDGQTNDCLGPALAPITALRIDQKLDDGVPTTGVVLTEFWMGWYGTSACAVTSGSSYVYDLSKATPICALVIKASF